jgi:hypothetical protein
MGENDILTGGLIPKPMFTTVFNIGRSLFRKLLKTASGLMCDFARACKGCTACKVRARAHTASSCSSRASECWLAHHAATTNLEEAVKLMVTSSGGGPFPMNSAEALTIQEAVQGLPPQVLRAWGTHGSEAPAAEYAAQPSGA